MEKINKTTLQQKIDNEQTFVVQYSASWCGPCKTLTLILDNIADSDNNLDIDIFKINVEDETELAKQKKISSIPFVEFYKKGQISTGKVGLSPRDFYEEQIKHILS